jgi:chromatin remodeling complex protein RSC6
MVPSINTRKSTTKSVEKVTVTEPDTSPVKKTRTKKTVAKPETPYDTENTSDEIVNSASDEIVKSANDEIVNSASDEIVNSASDEIVKSDSDEIVKSDSDEIVNSASDETKPVKKNSEQTENVFLSKLTSFLTKASVVNKEVRELQTIGRTLEKDFNAVVRALSKKKNKHRNNENRALSGFAMPSLLSKEMYTFLDIQEGTLIPRKQVTRMLNEYIKENNLRNEGDRRIILPDDNLKRIFNCTENDNVTYFNLQSYVKHHFIKEIKVVPTVEAV